MANFTWIGGISFDFTNPLNWDTGVLPNSTSTAIINTFQGLNVVISNGAPPITVGSLTIGGTGAAAASLAVGDVHPINPNGAGSGALVSLGAITVTSDNGGGGLVGGVGGTVTAPSLTVGASTIIGGGGTFTIANLVNNGLIQADGGNFGLGPLVVNGGRITGSGNIEVDATKPGVTSTFELGSATSQNIVVNIGSAGTAAVILDDPAGFTGSLILSDPTTHLHLSIASPPDALSSTDVSRMLVGNNTSLQFISGAESVALVDGTLSAGADTSEAFVARLYLGLLGRAHDLNGLSSWDVALRSSSKGIVAQTFIDSGEYQAAHAGQNDSQFVNSLYQSMLGRSADTGGLNFWTQALASGTARGDVAGALADSSEAKQHWSGATMKGVFAYDPNAAIVREDYLTAFGRESDTSGLAYWTNALKNGATSSQLAQDLTSSAEFQAIHGQQTDLQYVQSLYQSGLGRQAEATGAASWVNALQSGASRDGVLAAIAQSAEGQQHLQWALS